MPAGPRGRASSPARGWSAAPRGRALPPPPDGPPRRLLLPDGSKPCGGRANREGALRELLSPSRVARRPAGPVAPAVLSRRVGRPCTRRSRPFEALLSETPRTTCAAGKPPEGTSLARGAGGPSQATAMARTLPSATPGGQRPGPGLGRALAPDDRAAESGRRRCITGALDRAGSCRESARSGGPSGFAWRARRIPALEPRPPGRLALAPVIPAVPRRQVAAKPRPSERLRCGGSEAALPGSLRPGRSILAPGHPNSPGPAAVRGGNVQRSPRFRDPRRPLPKAGARDFAPGRYSPETSVSGPAGPRAPAGFAAKAASLSYGTCCSAGEFASAIRSAGADTAIAGTIDPQPVSESPAGVRPGRPRADERHRTGLRSCQRPPGTNVARPARAPRCAANPGPPEPTILVDLTGPIRGQTGHRRYFGAPGRRPASSRLAGL